MMMMMMMMMSGCRIHQSLQIGVCSLNSNKRYTHSCSCSCSGFLFNKAPHRRRFHFNLLPNTASASYSSSYSSSSSSVTNNNNNNDLGRLSSFISNNDVVPNSFTPAENENDRDPPSEGISSLAGGIVALGKFDALHIGHRELVIQASKIGVPFLLSFIGMAEVLGWEPRAPVVANCDRKRVLSSWAPLCGNVIPKEFRIEFSKVRSLTPQQFVEKLANELGVGGVVAGQNYRFGYRAAGDSSDLVRLCKEYGMKACIVNSVMDNKQEESEDRDCNNSKEQGQVSSTRVRHALANGDMDYVSKLLGRYHRLIIHKNNKEKKVFSDRRTLSAPRSCLLNLPPKQGIYKNCWLVIGGDDENAVPCRVIIDTTDIHLELLDELSPQRNHNFDSLGIDFGDSKV